MGQWRRFIWIGAVVGVVTTACVSLPPTLPANHKFASVPSKHEFLQMYARFLDQPSAGGLADLKRYMQSPEGQGDKYLISYRSQRKFSSKYFSKIIANIDKGDVYTVRSLFYLAFDLDQPNLVAESRSLSSEIMNVETGRHARTVKSAGYLLGVHLSYNYPELLIRAMAEEFKQGTEDQRQRYLLGVADFGLDDDQFRPLCPKCPSQPVTFLEAKWQKLIKAPVSRPAEVTVQQWFHRSKLAKAIRPITLHLRKLIFEPSDTRLAELKDACYPKSDPAADKPTINDLGDMVSRKIIEALKSGDVTVARAMIVVSGERCWKEVDEIDGPKPWLSTILVCRQPQTFVQAVALENPGGLFLNDIMKYESPQGWMNCTGQATRSGDLATYRVEKLKGLTTSDPTEQKVIQYLLKTFDTTSTELTDDDRAPASESDEPTEPAADIPETE